MKYILTPIAGLLVLLLGLSAYLVAYPASFFIKWDAAPTPGGDGGTDSITVRGDLPWWLSWYQTPDERFPGDYTMPVVKRWFADSGNRMASVYWMWRNRMMGFAAWVGKPADGHIPEGHGFWSRETDGVWRWACPLGPLKFVTGWQVSKTLSGRYLAVPVFTVKRP